MRRFVIFVVLLVVAVAVGLILGNRPPERTSYQLERAAMDLELARSMLPFKIAFRVLLGIILLATVAGLGWGGIRWLHRRADTVYPDRAGLYPIREGRLGNSHIFHDPNRALTGSTVYATGRPQVAVEHAVPEGQAHLQQQVTAQAQVAQAVRAAVSGSGAMPHRESLPIDMLSERRVSRPLPEVKSLDLEPSHIERLLLQDGDDDE